MIEALAQKGWGEKEAAYFPPTAGGAFVMLQAARSVYPELFSHPGWGHGDWFDDMSVRRELIPEEEPNASVEALLCAPPCLYDRTALLGPWKYRVEGGFKEPIRVRPASTDELHWRKAWEAGALTNECAAPSRGVPWCAMLAYERLEQSLKRSGGGASVGFETLMAARSRTVETTWMVVDYARFSCREAQLLFERLHLPVSAEQEEHFGCDACDRDNRDRHGNYDQAMSFTQNDDPL